MLLNVTESSTAWLVDLQPCRAFSSLQDVPKDDYDNCQASDGKEALINEPDQ